MPFTFSHPAAILPFRQLPKRWISITALTAGSIAPDFEYFLRMRVKSLYSHTWAGIFWFDLPLTIALCFVHHLIVRNRVIDHLPAFLARRMIFFISFNWPKYFQGNFIAGIISATTGISTHIFWDGFTHEGGLFVHLVKALRNKITFLGLTIPVYNLLQHVSTIAGGAIIIFVILKLPQNKDHKQLKSIYPFWITVLAIALAVFTIRFLHGIDYEFYGNIIITLISGVLAGIIITSMLFSITAKK